MEEVTCTVIGGVTYNPVCESDSKIRTVEDEDSMTGELHLEVALQEWAGYKVSGFKHIEHSDI